MDGSTNSSILPLSTRITLERLATERVFRWRSRRTDGEIDGRVYDDVMKELREEFNALDAGGGRSVYRLPDGLVDTSEDLVVKIAGPRSEHTDNAIPVSPGFVQNWREILVSRVEPMLEYIVPVIESSPNGLWLVMPYAEQETLEWDHDRIDARAAEIEAIDGLEPVMYGATTTRPDIYWASNWAGYEGDFRMIDYGGIAVTAPIEQPPEEYLFVDPARDHIE